MGRRFGWFRTPESDPGHPTQRIERHRRRSIHRHILGLYLDRRLGELQGALLRSRGAGRYVSYESGPHRCWELPDALRRELLRLHSEPNVGLAEQVEASIDLSEWIAGVLPGLLARSGANQEKILGLAFHDDGWCGLDLDGRPTWYSSVAPHRLAERVGLPVIAGMRQADVAAGGQGGPLEPLAWWFLLADRSPTTASTSRVLVKLDRPAGLVLLPASDGLDAEHPLIRFESLAFEARRRLDLVELAGCPTRLAGLAVQGRQLVDLLGWFAETAGSETIGSSRVGEAALAKELADDPQAVWGPAAGGSLADLARTLDDWLVQRIGEFVGRIAADVPEGSVELLLSGNHAPDGYLVGRLAQTLKGCRVTGLEQLGWGDAPWNALTTGVLGMMHIDQQPASLPWLTGADVPRLHGTLYPGQLAAWRRLVLEMADYRPPPMKLRDAI